MKFTGINKLGPNGISMDTEKELRTAMKRFKEVRAVYLFGSAASGKAGPLSDIDIAILLKSAPKPGVLGLKLRLLSALTGVFGSNRVDIVILNDSPPLIVFEAISKGKLIYGTRKEVADFEAKSCSIYHDLRHYYDKYADETISRIAEKGFS